MHICFVGEIATPSFKTGGIGTFVANISAALCQLGHRVTVVSFRHQQQSIEVEQLESYSIHWINIDQWGRFRMLKVKLDTNNVLRQIHAAHPIDIVETPEYGLFALQKLKGAKFVVRLNGGHVFFNKSTTDTPARWRQRLVEKWSLRNADAIIGVSKYVLVKTQEYYPFIKRLPSEIVHNPIVVEHFNPASFQVPANPNYILFYGSLTEKKGVRQLIQAMQFVHASFPEAELHIYGRDTRIRPTGNSYRVLLEALIQQEQIKNVFIHEALPNHEMPGLLASAGIIVLPSHMEAMPLAWLEAMAMARPFIGSQLGPGPEVVAPHQNGLLCDPMHPEDIAQKILYMMEHPAEAKAMGEAARIQVLKEFNATTLAEKNIAFFQSICGK